MEKSELRSFKGGVPMNGNDKNMYSSDGFGREPGPERRIYREIIYNDRTNERAGNICDGTKFESFEAFEKLLPYIQKDGCNRICASSDYEYALYYKTSGGWVRMEENREILDIDCLEIDCIQAEISASLDEKERDVEYDENPEDSPELVFWKKRRRMRRILIDMDPSKVTRFPALKTGQTVYAKESYDLVKALEGINDKNETDYVMSQFELQYGIKLSEDEKRLILDRYLNKIAWHACPVCKSRYFYSEAECCPVCGWRNNREQEREPKCAVTTDNAETLRMMQLYYYLKNCEETRDEAERIWTEYHDVFNALIKVKKALEEEQDARFGVFIFGVNIRTPDFVKLRNNTTSQLEALLASVEDAKADPDEEEQEYTEFNHPGRDKCDQLREIRKKIAEENEIEFNPEECHHTGPCKGTCPACEAEVKYLEEQLAKKRGKIKLVGIAEECMQENER